MLNTHKLLYILPDLAYLAELLPAKKEYTFSIQAFRQINGEFLNETELLPASIEKLFSKIDSEEYHLILPDFLFTNTVITVDGTTKSTVLEHVEKKLLPDLDLSKETHEIEITVLTSFKGASKVQISAIEKSVLAPIRAASEKAKVTISAISPLSWVMKSIISLEPSISVLQVGSHLYAAQHYIGVDQASNFPMDEYDAIVETIKTLKGAEPSIQSVYLVSSALVEEDIKGKLSDTLPIQQLASFKEDDAKMPSYIKFIIESSMRTISIPDFPVPKFKLGKASEEDHLTLTSDVTTTEDKVKTEDKELPEPTKKEKEVEEPDKKEEVKATNKKSKNEEVSSKETDPADSQLPEPTSIPTAPAKIPAVKETESTPMTDTKTEKIDTKKEEIPSTPEIDTKVETTKEIEEKVKDEKVDLSQFAVSDKEKDDDLAVENTSKKKEDNLTEKNIPAKVTKKVIKNSSGVNNMLKMVFITIAVFFITIAIGVGVGLGLLKMSEDKVADTTPEVVVETPAPTPEPTPEIVEIDKESISILVVNATTKAGYAGKVKTLLVDSEIEDVDAGNAKGDYEEGTDYILMLEENKALQDLLEKSTELTFEYSKEIETEDANEDYDAVIVLAN